MAIPYAETGRTGQKQRTREALLAAARELLTEGANPTVEHAADRAGISRTTAYRYFANQREIILACFPEADAKSLLAADAPKDPRERLDIVTAKLGEQLLANEPQLRAQLRLALDPKPPDKEQLPLRQGRAIGWIEDALSPLRSRMRKAELRRLVLAIRATIGIEPMVWLTDIGGLSPRAAVDLMRSSARTVLEAALRELPKG